MSNKKVRKLFLVVLVFLFAGLILTPTSLMYLLTSFPMRWPSEQPLPGRPTARAVAGEDIAALNYISNYTSHTSQNFAVVTSDGFLAKIAQALLPFRAFNGTNNIFSNSAIITDIITGNITLTTIVASITNSSLVFLLFNDWYIRTNKITDRILDSAASLFGHMGGNYKHFGEEYNVYLLWIDVRNVNASAQKISDLSFNDNNGAMHGNSLFVPGIKGSALLLNGKDATVKVNSSELINPSNVTLEAWVYLNTKSTYSNPIVSKWYGGAFPLQNQFILSMYPTRNEVYFYLSDGTKIFYANTNTSISYQWLHIVATYDGQRIRFYFNGSLVAEKDWMSSVVSSNTPLFIGSKSSEVEPQYFNGLIDEVRIYNRTLNSTEVSYSYRNLSPMSTDGLVLWFSFDE
jgi:hypothetical protein